MKAAARRRWLRATTWSAGLTAAAVTAWLIAGWIADHRRAPADAERIAALEERVRGDAGAAAELDGERQRQTERSLAREARNHRLGWLLLGAVGVFLTGAKQLQGSSPPQPSRNPHPNPLPPHHTLPSGEGAPSPPLRWPFARFLFPLPLRERARVRDSARRARSADSATSLPEAAEAPELDLAFVDQVVARRGRDPEATIAILQEIQFHYRYLPDEALRRVCELTEITPARIAGVAGFYARFRRTPVGEHMVRVCHGTACHVAGIEHVHDELRRRLAIPEGDDTDPRRRFTLEPVACLGCCSLAPVIMIGDDTAGHLTPATAWTQLRQKVPS